MTDSSEDPTASKPSSSGGGGNPARFVPLVVLGVLFTVIGIVFGSQFCAAQHAKKLLRTGEPAVAEIIEVVDTGNRYNRNPEVELTLRVTPEGGGEPYEARITEVLDPETLRSYVQGVELDVRYDPADPRDIAIAGLREHGAADAGSDPAPPTEADAPAGVPPGLIPPGLIPSGAADAPAEADAAPEPPAP